MKNIYSTHSKENTQSNKFIISEQIGYLVIYLFIKIIIIIIMRSGRSSDSSNSILVFYMLIY